MGILFLQDNTCLNVCEWGIFEHNPKCKEMVIKSKNWNMIKAVDSDMTRTLKRFFIFYGVPTSSGTHTSFMSSAVNNFKVMCSFNLLAPLFQSESTHVYIYELKGWKACWILERDLPAGIVSLFQNNWTQFNLYGFCTCFVNRILQGAFRFNEIPPCSL